MFQESRSPTQRGVKKFPNAVMTKKRSVLEDEGDLELHQVGADLAVLVDLDLLVLDPGGLDVVEGLAGAGDALFEGILEADGG